VLELKNQQFELSGRKNLLLKTNSIIVNDDNAKVVLLQAIYWGVCTSDVKSYVSGKGAYFGHEMLLKVIYSRIPNLVKGTYVVPIHTNPQGKHTIKLSYQKYFIMKEEDIDNLFPIESIDLKNFIFLDTLSCVLHAIKKIAKYCDIDKSEIVILGDGFVGQLFDKVLKSKGAVTQISRRNHIVSNYSANVCIDTTGNAEFINRHIELIDNEGIIILFSQINMKNLNIEKIRKNDMCIFYSYFCQRDDVADAIEYLRENSLDDLVQVFSGAEKLKDVLDLTEEKQIIRGIISLE
jgi:threonine dehydrogenase-like Zn-dependent dehydrogenase